MPELDGFESTEAIRKLEESTGKFVPIIAMTAELSNEAREHCFASGMNDCVTKPVTLEKLAAVLQKWLAN